MDGKNVKGCEMDFQPGNPSLPAKQLCLALPANTRPYSITVNSISTEPIEGLFEIIPQQPPIPIGFSSTSLFVKPDSCIYARDAFFPQENAGIIFSGAYHGTSLAYVSVIPIRYNPVQKKLELITRIDFTLNLQSHEYSLKKYATQEWVDDKIASLKRLVNNFEDVGRYKYVPEIVDKSFFSRPQTGKIATAPAFYNYVIITSTGLSSYFDPFVKWLKRKGIDAGVVTITDIESTYEGDGQVPESAGGSIRAYLHDGYDNHNTEWALLGGDETVVDCLYGVASPSYYVDIDPGYIVPTDLYYSEFSGEWDCDADGHYGETSDDDPGYIPDIYVGRVPCDTGAEIQCWIEKVLKYAQDPGNGNGSYLQKAYSVAADQLVGQPSSNTSLFNSAGFTTHNYTVETPPNVAYDSVTNPSGGAQIISEMNQLYGIYNWHCHGAPHHFAVRTGTVLRPDSNPPSGYIEYNGYDKAGVFSLDSQTSSHYLSESGNGLDNMTNKDYYSVVYSLCCDIAAYDNYQNQYPCMAESWTLLSEKGGPLLFGNTRYGWITGSFELQGEFYDALIAGDVQAGNALNTSKTQYGSTYLDYSNNLFGDPELSIWTATPSTINPTITVGVSTVTVNANMSGCNIAVSSYDLSTKNVQTDVSSYTFNTSVRPLFIVITKKNYLPYIAVTGGTLAENQTWGEEFTNINVLDDITVPSGKTLTFNENTTVRFADGVGLSVSGTLNVAGGVTFTHTPGIYWSGISIESGGTLNVTGDITIEYATSGLGMYDTADLSSGTNKITISHCTSSGVYVSSCSPTLNRFSISDLSYGASGFSIVGNSSYPIIHNSEILNSMSGINQGSSTDASVYLTNIESVTNDCIYLSSLSDITLEYAIIEIGNNNINPASGQKAINNSATTNMINARCNYWGETPPGSLFGDSTYVVYTNPLASRYEYGGAGKIVAADGGISFASASQLESQERWVDAADMYKNLLTNSVSSQDKRRAIKSLLRVEDNSGKDYTGINSLAQEELAKEDTKDGYRMFLDQFLFELELRAGNIDTAMSGFLATAEKYEGTPVEVDMLARTAEVYGKHFGDKAKAKEYADKAAAINPGQLSLLGAYSAAGIEYNPSLYEDIFAVSSEENTEKPTNPSESVSSIEEYVTLSPNPANPITTITYSIKTASDVKLSVYSINGQKVATLVDGPVSAGVHSVTFDGSKYASGVYLYQFQSAGFRKTGKMMLLK